MGAPRLGAVVVNARDLEVVADFWKALLEVGERHRMPGFVWLERQPGLGMSLAVQQVEEPTPGRNRLHLDFGVQDMDAAHQRVLDLGGTEVERHAYGDFGWTVYGDPEGNEFCLAQANPDDHA